MPQIWLSIARIERISACVALNVVHCVGACVGLCRGLCRGLGSEEKLGVVRFGMDLQAVHSLNSRLTTTSSSKYSQYFTQIILIIKLDRSFL